MSRTVGWSNIPWGFPDGFRQDGLRRLTGRWYAQPSRSCNEKVPQRIILVVSRSLLCPAGPDDNNCLSDTLRRARRVHAQRRLPPRSDRLWPKSAEPPMAGRRQDRRSVRAQLRRGRRELHPSRRQGVGGLPLRDDRRGRPRRCPPHEYGIALRVRQPHRVAVADLQAVPGTRHPAHPVRRRHGHGAQSAGHRVRPGGRLRNVFPRLSLDRLPIRTRRRGTGTHAKGDRNPYGNRRRAAARLVHRT